MSLTSRKWQSVVIVLSSSAFLAVLGCGGDESGLARRYKVTGKVTYNGAPVANGTVNFIPNKPPPPDGRAATGTIKDGFYSMTTVGDNDGALPGDYKVAIIALSIDLASAAQNADKMIHQGDAAHQKAMKEAKPLIPSKYGLIEKSGLTATVPSQSVEINFPLAD